MIKIRTIVSVIALSLIAVLLILIVSAPSPVELKVSETSCLTSECLVSQTVAFELKVNPSENVKIIEVEGHSLAIEGGQAATGELPLDINKFEERSIPIEVSLKADLDDKINHSIDFGLVVESENIFWNLKNWLLGLAGLKNQATLNQTFKVHYPHIEFDKEMPAETDVTRTYDFQLLNKEDISYVCKLKVVLSKDLELIHSELPQISQERNGTIYESDFEEIKPTLNSECCNSVIIEAVGGYKQEAQLTFSPICKIGDREVIIKPEEESETWSHGARPLPS